MDIKKIFIIAGPNGAGKTTFAREFLPDEAGCLHFVNADLIAAGLSPFAPEAVAFQAGRLMLAQIADHVAHGRSFALETTLSGLGYARQIPQWRLLGYAVSLHFLALPNAEVAIEPVAQRVRQGITFPKWSYVAASRRVKSIWHAIARWWMTGMCMTTAASSLF